jgi:hypothetical protein
VTQRGSVLLLTVFLLASSRLLLADDSEWGHLSGRFVYDGDPPPAKVLPVPASQRVTIGGKLVHDESLVVGEDGGIANVFIWLRPTIGVKPPIHPSYEATEEDVVELAARDLRLQPHALFLRTSQTLRFRHVDERVGYNLNFDAFDNAPFCGLVSAGETTDIRFGKSEKLPIDISCNIHPWIHGRMLVLDHPYAAITDRDGRFKIQNLPVGKWDFVVVHEKSGYIKRPQVGGKQMEWTRGTFQHEVTAGDNVLGDIVVAAEEFQRK